MFMSFSCTMLRDWLIPSIWCCDSHRHISYLTLTCIYRYLPCYTYYLISDTGTCHTMLITWYMISVLAVLCLLLDIWYRYLPCYTYRLIPDTWYCGTCIILHIHGYYFYGDLAWLLYCYQIFGTPELLYSWTPVFLNPWKRVTPDIILILTLE